MDGTTTTRRFSGTTPLFNNAETPPVQPDRHAVITDVPTASPVYDTTLRREGDTTLQ
jgi:hypothetical protein